MTKTAMMIVCLMMMSFTLITAQELELTNRYSYNLYPYIPAVNVTINASVNNSIFWDGNAYSDSRWLDLNGGNANQDIDIGSYDMFATAFHGDGSQLTGIVFNYPHDQELNTTDSVRFVNLNVTNHIETFTLNATNITTENINVTKNSTIWLGGVPISSATTFGGEQVVTFGDAFVNATGYFGDGGFLENISFVNGTVLANAFNGSNYYGGDFYGDNFTGGNAYFDFYDWTAELPYLVFNGTFLQFNETYLNKSVNNIVDDSITTALNNLTFDNITLGGETITSWSAVNYTTTNDTVIYNTGAFSGAANFVVPTNINYQITQIIVTPTSLTGNYRFGMYELGIDETIDADLINHKGVWNIQKNYILDNQVTLNFTNVAPANTFTINIKYLKEISN